MVSLQPPQRRLKRRHQIVTARIIGHRRRDPALCREHHARTQARCRVKHLPQQCLGVAKAACAVKAVNVGGIEQGHARLKRRLDQAAPLRDRGVAETPHPPRNRADQDSALAERAGIGCNR